MAVPDSQRGQAEAARRELCGPQQRGSDHLLLLALHQQWAAVLRRQGDRRAGDWCSEHFASVAALRMVGLARGDTVILTENDSNDSKITV